MRALILALALLALPFGGLQAQEGQAVEPGLRAALMEAVNDTESFENRYVAEVWLMDMSQRLADRVPDPKERIELLRLVHREARRADLPPNLVLAVIQVESNFNRFAISHAGARGLMQIMPFWLDELDMPDANLFHVDTNLRFGCTILRYYLDLEKGNLNHALARYNGSRGRLTYPLKVFDALRERWYRQ